MNETLIKAANCIAESAEKLLENNRYISIAIDGRCASGKTTLAAQLEQLLDCNIIHIDDFFLRPEQRTAERLAIPGENIDHERFLAEVLLPVCQGNDILYSPYDCSTQKLGEKVFIPHKRITVIEGSYSCHPVLIDKYSLRVFLTVAKDIQMQRITQRNGSCTAEIFRNKWIPLEEKYFSAYSVREKCELKFSI